jgi:hypothetical protein
MASSSADRKFAHLEYLILRGAIFLIFVVELARFLIYEFRHLAPP